MLLLWLSICLSASCKLFYFEFIKSSLNIMIDHKASVTGHFLLQCTIMAMEISNFPLHLATNSKFDAQIKKYQINIKSVFV